MSTEDQSSTDGPTIEERKLDNLLERADVCISTTEDILDSIEITSPDK